MTKHQNSTRLMKASFTKLPCAVAQVRWRAVGRLAGSLRLWRRAILILVIFYFALLCADTARAQTPLANGASQAGTLVVSTTNAYTFTANTGDNIVLRLGTVGFDGNLDLYGPNGALLKTAASGTDAELDYTATNSGTFTALVNSYFSAGVGTYVLHFAQFPGPPPRVLLE